MNSKNEIETVSRPPGNTRLAVGFNKHVTPADHECKIRHIQILDPAGSSPLPPE